MTDYTNTQEYKAIEVLKNKHPGIKFDYHLESLIQYIDLYSTFGEGGVILTEEFAIKYSFKSELGLIIFDKMAKDGFFPTASAYYDTLETRDERLDFMDKLPLSAYEISPSEALDFVYPDSGKAQKETLLNAINEGQVKTADVMNAILFLSVYNAKPSTASILDIADELSHQQPIKDINGVIDPVFLYIPKEKVIKEAIENPQPPKVPNTDTPIVLPEAPYFDLGLNDIEEDVLIGEYIGAYNRAPDNEGIHYWATRFKDFINEGMDSGRALAETGKYMYWSGQENGEQGTNLSTQQFVEFAYNNSLGRQSDAEGISYWVNQIDSGVIQRGEFLIHFLHAALNNTSNNDGDYIRNRVAVAEFAAQEHVSGPSYDITEKVKELGSLIQNVKDAPSALKSIEAIQKKYDHLIPDFYNETETFNAHTVLIGMTNDTDTNLI